MPQATVVQAEAAAPTEASKKPPRSAVPRIRADLIDQLVNGAGELSIARARIEGEMIGLKGSLLDLTKTSSVCAPVARDRNPGRNADAVAHARTKKHADAGFDPLGGSTASRASRN